MSRRTRIALINPPRSMYDVSEVAPPLSLLRLAAVVRDLDCDVQIFDLNLLWHSSPAIQACFYPSCVDLILRFGADLCGFTSMAVDSHVAIELARLIKEISPSVIIALGGPHFSSIAAEVANVFPWIDHVVRGEGELDFRSLVTKLCSSSIGIHRDAARIDTSHPPVSYSGIDLQAYFEINPARVVDFEGGRGCRFRCKFCYSPSHWSYSRSFPPKQKLVELSQLCAAGVKRVFFVEDNFLNYPSEALEFCTELQHANLPLSWHCYATFPQLNGSAAEAMAAAGCDAVFTGIDAIGSASQAFFGKRFVSNLDRLRVGIRSMTSVGIMPTCAFLISPRSCPSGNDLDATIEAALVARLEGANIRLNTLTLYHSTVIREASEAEWNSDNLKINLLMDVPPPTEFNPLAESHPHLFPFHSRFVPLPGWHNFLAEAHCLFTLLAVFPRQLDEMRHAGLSPASIAKKVLQELPNLKDVAKTQRRQLEVEIAEQIFDLAAESPTNQNPVIEAFMEP